MACKECIHDGVCHIQEMSTGLELEEYIREFGCENFKNKADFVEVEHGRIIETIENGRMKRVFSCCGTDFTKLTMWTSPTCCPHCGAKMDSK